jgi:microcystin degradation protein MlrC
LRAAMPVDAVYVPNHGASSAEGEDDTEGVMMRALRDIVGPDVPIIATHDLHCNVSPATVQALDALIAYRTNPHVDQRERAAEAADLLHEMFAGTKMATATIRLPLTPPSVTLGTKEGPYADIIARGVAMMKPAGQGTIANVSVTAGFVFSDLPKCGLTITVTARGDQEAARRTALELARAAWADRARYVPNVIDVEQAVALARQADRPLLFADVADNPGGGGRGSTSWLLSAFHEARIQNTVLGVFVDPELAAQAHQLGDGASFEAVFNRVETEHSKRFVAQAKVLLLTDGEGVGRRGVLQGRKFSLGPSALLELAGSGLRVIVGSLRRQLCEPAMVEMHRIDIATVSNLIVKSRGHYRAGFDEFFTPDRTHDVDSWGLTTPNLKLLEFKHLPRPVWPIDEDVHWKEPDWAESLQ